MYPINLIKGILYNTNYIYFIFRSLSQSSDGPKQKSINQYVNELKICYRTLFDE